MGTMPDSNPNYTILLTESQPLCFHIVLLRRSFAMRCLGFVELHMTLAYRLIGLYEPPYVGVPSPAPCVVIIKKKKKKKKKTKNTLSGI